MQDMKTTDAKSQGMKMKCRTIALQALSMMRYTNLRLTLHYFTSKSRSMKKQDMKM